MDKMAVFKGKKIRRIIHDNEWWFSVVDVIEVLTDSNRPSAYWTAMKARVKNESDIQLTTICRQLKLESSDGKMYDTDCANTEGSHLTQTLEEKSRELLEESSRKESADR